MNITITLFCPRSGLAPWSNGAHQNCFALALCLAASGHDVTLANAGDGPIPPPHTLPPILRRFPFVPLPEALPSTDLLIEGSAQISASQAAEVHARGGKVVAFRFGHWLAIDASRVAYNRPSGAIFNGTVFDEVWTTSQHEHTNGPAWEVLHRCPVRILPHIWHPAFVDANIAAFPAGLSAAPPLRRANGKKRIAIFEPNIDVIKTSHIALLACEMAWRTRPDLIDRVYVTNAAAAKEHLSFRTFAKALDIVHATSDDGQPVCSFEARYPMPWFLAAHEIDVVVSHQWVGVPNYSHYDALYMGRLLVHNARESKMPGLAYDGNDCNWAGRSLTQMITHDDRRDTRQRDYTKRYLATVHATDAANVDAHNRAVEEVFAR